MVSTVEARDGTRLAVERWDGPERPRFLLVHGLASNRRLWDGVGMALAAAGHPSTAVDLRGHGESERPGHGYDFPTMVDDLAAVIAADGGGSVVAAGQSFGGNLVLELAVRRPELVTAVACVDGGFIHLRSRFEGWAAVEAALAPPRFDGLRWNELERRVRERHPGWPEEAIAAQLANFEQVDGRPRPRLARAHHLELLRALWGQDPGLAAATIEVPVTVIVASEDSPADAATVEGFAGRLRRGRLRFIDGHHDLHAQHPAEVAAELLSLAEAAR